MIIFHIRHEFSYLISVQVKGLIICAQLMYESLFIYEVFIILLRFVVYLSSGTMITGQVFPSVFSLISYALLFNHPFTLWIQSTPTTFLSNKSFISLFFSHFLKVSK